MLRGERMIAACIGSAVLPDVTISFFMKFTGFVCHYKLTYTVTITVLSGVLLLKGVRLSNDEREEERRQKKG